MHHRHFTREAPFHFGGDSAIDLLNDLQMPRQHSLEHLHRPSLERFRQQRVVRVRARLHRDRPRVLPRQRLIVHQRAHQLRNGERRMRVI